MAAVVFFVAALGAIAGAIGVIAMRNPFYSVLALVSHLLSLAALFLLLRAEFVAAAQVVVYAGAVMVLYVFVVAYVGGGAEPTGPSAGAGLKIAAPLFAGALFAELIIATLGSGLKAITSEGAGYAPGFGSPEQIGKLLLTDFLLPFEVASYLLLIAAVGAVMLARRRRGLEGDEDARAISVASLLAQPAPQGVGTMSEAVGGRMDDPEPATGGTLGTETVPPREKGGW